MSMGELIFIGIIVLLVVPPEKLPGLARDLARLLNDIRRSTTGVWEELKKDTINPMDELRAQKKEVEDYMKFIGSPDPNPHAPILPTTPAPTAVVVPEPEQLSLPTTEATPAPNVLNATSTTTHSTVNQDSQNSDNKKNESEPSKK